MINKKWCIGIGVLLLVAGCGASQAGVIIHALAPVIGPYMSRARTMIQAQQTSGTRVRNAIDGNDRAIMRGCGDCRSLDWTPGDRHHWPLERRCDVGLDDQRRRADRL